MLEGIQIQIAMTLRSHDRMVKMDKSTEKNVSKLNLSNNSETP